MERTCQSLNPRSLRVFTGTQVGAAQTEYPGGPESKRKKGRIRGGGREDALRGSVVEWGSRRGRTTLTEDGGVHTQVVSASQRLWGRRHEISSLVPAGSWL